MFSIIRLLIKDKMDVWTDIHLYGLSVQLVDALLMAPTGERFS